MPVTTFKIGGRKYVLMPESEFLRKTAGKNGTHPTTRRKMAGREIDRIEGELALKALKNPRRVTAADFFKKLGV